jgi:hypothetical protein
MKSLTMKSLLEKVSSEKLGPLGNIDLPPPEDPAIFKDDTKMYRYYISKPSSCQIHSDFRAPKTGSNRCLSNSSAYPLHQEVPGWGCNSHATKKRNNSRLNNNSWPWCEAHHQPSAHLNIHEPCKHFNCGHRAIAPVWLHIESDSALLDLQNRPS